ncbi:hypothetical protein MYP_3844 [Sporocytophaga myxococcoides]|uniref:Uncharacterized protein n=1 Tax=Sporocytophaga myxococcoides TaxID=153721 RepID=A0A098LJF8_9BACT|nr:hypothetical protein MYP_3844 [Sporocytophaga myxococcoides]
MGRTFLRIVFIRAHFKLPTRHPYHARMWFIINQIRFIRANSNIFHRHAQL